MSHEVITETEGPIEERESNNILRRSLRIASEYWNDWKEQSRRETITPTIPLQYTEGGDRMPIDTAELRKQCEVYVKKRVGTSLRMNNAKEQKQDDAASTDAEDAEAADDSSLKHDSGGRRKMRRKDTDRTESSSLSNSPTRKSSRRSSRRSSRKPDPPARNNGDQSFRDKCVESRDRCVQNAKDLSARSIKAFDDLSDRGYKFAKGLTRRQLVYIAAGLVLFIIINIVIGVATSDRSKSVSTTGYGGPTAAPTFDLYTGSGEYLHAILDNKVEQLNDDAFNWLKNVDSWEAPRNARNIDQLWIERYALALFYLSTITPDVQWKNAKNWMSDESVCVWMGVKCNIYDEVSEIVLSHNEIVGSIPQELFFLTGLEKLKLDSNEFASGIPREVGNLTHLKHLDLYYNLLTGTLPTEIGKLSSLTGLYLRGNMLTGSLPDTFGGLTSLTELQLSDNKFRGDIGKHLTTLMKLVTLAADRNGFTGSLPPAMGKLTSLKWIRMDENEISGSLPLSIGYLTALQTVILGNNMITGTLPRDLTGLTKLHQLDLRWNKIGGSIPPGIKRLSNLWHLNLSTNQLNGLVPELPTSLTKQDYKNGPFCSLAGNYFVDIQNGEQLGCKTNGQRS